MRFSLIENEERTRQALRGIKQMFLQDSLGFESLSTASRVVALAGKLGHALGVFADFTAVFLFFGGNTVTGGVCTCLYIGDWFTSASL